MSQLPFDPLLLAILSPLAVALAIALGLPKRFSIKLAYVGFGLPALLALHEALRLIIEETLEQRFKRHLHSSLALQAGVEAMGLKLYAPKEYRLNSVLGIEVPAGIDDARARKYMTDRFKVLIADAFGR